MKVCCIEVGEWEEVGEHEAERRSGWNIWRERREGHGAECRGK